MAAMRPLSRPKRVRMADRGLGRAPNRATPIPRMILHNVYYRSNGNAGRGPPRMNSPSNIDRLVAIMERLRDPKTGCEWDTVQTFETIAPYTIEEAYEAADALQRGDMADLKDELGDLLLQVIFHSRMAEEAGLFDLSD